MYRFLSRAVCAARTPSLCAYEPCPAKSEQVSRACNGVRVNAFCTSSLRICEKKDPSDQVETTGAEKESSQTEKAGQQEEPAALKTDAHQEAAVGAVQVKGAKTGKESLMDMLGAMKVEVTSKRKLKNLKLEQSFKSAIQHQSKPEAMEGTSGMFQKAMGEPSSQSETLDPDLIAAASAAASTLPNSSQVASELLKQLRQRKALTEAQRREDANNIGVIIADMKVGKRTGRQKAWSSNQIQYDDDGRGYTDVGGITGELANIRKRRNIFQSRRLNIFSLTTNEVQAESAVAKPTLWDVEFANDLSLATNQLPRNRFEEMIQWTKEGKLWKYPIDNEIGLEEEASVPFHEHVFLEKHLEEGFPAQGPVRHFMELVVAGLSKNPYMTVQEKKEHISWFRDYFHQKEEVLNDADVYLS
ncbi:28S ribosomal protein S31, mitochondrial [Kryptolebias marmoratus]|uniref:28S ribosomal protein S31, mitochondrial n=1 Tax=Kryptolebias marmoratus TaxID=37003 RepID=UPI0007F8A6B1|nr:28S ribosomal protein S31, mitochondrial [Kryptolebias marmoratus]